MINGVSPPPLSLPDVTFLPEEFIVGFRVSNYAIRFLKQSLLFKESSSILPWKMAARWGYLYEDISIMLPQWGLYASIIGEYWGFLNVAASISVKKV